MMNVPPMHVVFDANMEAYKGVMDYLPSQVKLGQIVDLSTLQEDPLFPEDDQVLCVFTGGSSDVDPSLYNQFKHSSTQISKEDDEAAFRLYDFADINNYLSVGICRGFQFLWVMSGGILTQQILGHNGDHPTTPTAAAVQCGLFDSLDIPGVVQWLKSPNRVNLIPEGLMVNSSHHQACIPNRSALDIATPLLVSNGQAIHDVEERNVFRPTLHVEAARSISAADWCGVQYHPEWKSCPIFGKEFFRAMLAELIGVK